MQGKTRILLKITGEFLRDRTTQKPDSTLIRHIAQQIRTLLPTHYFGIVVGGGNFFRGNSYGPTIGLSPTARDQVGMLATLMNGLIIQDLFEQEHINSSLLTALECPAVGNTISPQNLSTALTQHDCVIFAGGLGSPFFTTDTNAVVRALQLEATSIWKATKTDGIYTNDPERDPQAEKLTTITYDQALAQRLAVMDMTAFTLAQKHNLTMRIFSLFEPYALIKASQEAAFGSTILPSAPTISKTAERTVE